MKVILRNRAFLLVAGLVVLMGAALFGGVLAIRVLAAPGAATSTSAKAPASYNEVDSYGMTGYEPLTLTATSDTPPFIKSRLEQNRGMVLLVYVDGAAADEDMLKSFTALKGRYSADASFMDFESHRVGEVGDVLEQLRVSDPPILAVINGKGEVKQLYTGWIDSTVMEQVISNAARGL